MSQDPLWKRLRDFDWSIARLSAKEAKEIQKLLQDLAGKKEARSMRASQQLWILIKANPDLGPTLRPFLQEIWQISENTVKSEIDDLLELV